MDGVGELGDKLETGTTLVIKRGRASGVLVGIHLH